MTFIPILRNLFLHSMKTTHSLECRKRAGMHYVIFPRNLRLKLFELQFPSSFKLHLCQTKPRVRTIEMCFYVFTIEIRGV